LIENIEMLFKSSGVKHLSRIC